MKIKTQYEIGDIVRHNLLPDKQYFIDGVQLDSTLDISYRCCCFDCDGRVISAYLREKEIEKVPKDKIGFC